jgi:hypothetical protein
MIAVIAWITLRILVETWLGQVGLMYTFKSQMSMFVTMRSRALDILCVCGGGGKTR